MRYCQGTLQQQSLKMKEATWSERAVWAFEALASLFLVCVLVVVPLVLLINFTVIERDASIDNLGVDAGEGILKTQEIRSKTFERAIQILKTKYSKNPAKTLDESLILTTHPPPTTSSITTTEKPYDQKEAEENYDPEFAPNCPTCKYLNAAKYFKPGVHCPPHLNNEKCCFCGKPPKVEKKPFPINMARFDVDDTKADVPEELQNPRCKSCNVIHQVSWIGDGFCDPDLDNLKCCFDGGDCLTNTLLRRCMCGTPASYSVKGTDKMEYWKILSPQTRNYDDVKMIYYDNHKVHTFFELANGVCDSMYNRSECCFDGGDCILPRLCPTCTQPMTSSKFGDGICDPEYNSVECCFDDGDCANKVCRTCPSSSRDRVGDGNCDLELDTAICCFDGDDCSSTSLGCTEQELKRVGDGICDFDLATNPACQFDGNDCYALHPAQCQTCLAENANFRLGDYNCDEDLNTLSCCYDGGDCSPVSECGRCQSFLVPMAWSYINDGVCDSFNLNSQCCYDGDDCFSRRDVEICPSCNEYRRSRLLHYVHSWHFNGATLQKEFKHWLATMIESSRNGELGDGVCNVNLNVEECCYDGGDCLICPTCPYSSLVNDGFCDEELITEECCYDMGDCKQLPQSCFSNCTVPGLSPLQLSAFLMNGVCDHPLNKPECCFDGGLCLGVQDTCEKCPFHESHSKIQDGVCDEILNNEMCCYDGGDCPRLLEYNPTPFRCNHELCDHVVLGNGICETDTEGLPCCSDRKDCMNEQPHWDEQTCETMTTWTLYDTCPLCCNRTGGKPKLMYDICADDTLVPECCFGDCLERLSLCPTCKVPDYVKWINDGVCDSFLNNQDCCFDFEDCVALKYKKSSSVRYTKIFGDIQREYLKYSDPRKSGVSVNFLVSEDQYCNKARDGCFLSAFLSVIRDRSVSKWQTEESCAGFPQCNYDKSKIGDHICDPLIAAEEACCFDKGDCVIVDTSLTNPDASQCPTCTKASYVNLGDGFCDEDLKNEECCYDLGDCLPEKCSLDKVIQSPHFGRVESDNRDFLRSLFSNFGGSFEKLLQADLGDNVCNKVLDNADCFYDGWDCRASPCSTCNLPIFVEASQILGNGICDMAYNTLQCCYDAGDCLTLAEGKDVRCVTCDSEFIKFLGDGICQGALNNEDCCFDLNDCSPCATCQPQFWHLIGDSTCHKELDHLACCRDGLDCVEYAWESKYNRYNRYLSPSYFELQLSLDVTDETQVGTPREYRDVQVYGGKSTTIHTQNLGFVDSKLKCPTCLRRNLYFAFNIVRKEAIEYLGDGVCQMYLANPECCFDAGDCACLTCDNPRWSYKIGDGICDEVLNTNECCFDAGDCDKINFECPSCPRDFYIMLKRTGKCIPSFNTPMCCYSLGNCKQESFDCDLSGLYPALHINNQATWAYIPIVISYGCPEQWHDRLGDGICDPDIRIYEDKCCFDGGDCIYSADLVCPSCKAHKFAHVALAKGLCIEELNNEDCCFSMGACSKEKCDTCQGYSEYISDGVCDPVLNHEECCYDGHDCFIQGRNCTELCPFDTTWMGDGTCDTFLRIPECCYDGGDCLTFNDEVKVNYPLGSWGYGYAWDQDQAHMNAPSAWLYLRAKNPNFYEFSIISGV